MDSEMVLEGRPSDTEKCKRHARSEFDGEVKWWIKECILTP